MVSFFSFFSFFSSLSSPSSTNFRFTSHRHNTRKYEQVHSDELHRRIHRRSYRIPAKSYVLNRDNNEMCAAMNANDE